MRELIVIVWALLEQGTFMVMIRVTLSLTVRHDAKKTGFGLTKARPCSCNFQFPPPRLLLLLILAV